MFVTTDILLQEDNLLDIDKTLDISDKMAIYWNNPKFFFCFASKKTCKLNKICFFIMKFYLYCKKKT